MATTRDIRIPADSIPALHRAFTRDLGAEAAARALREAGHAAGDALFERLSRGSGDELGAATSASFWDRLTALFRELGWGVIEHQELHPGVAALVGREWFELPEGARTGCHFTTGVLANLLGRVAGGDVAVLEVGCDDGSTGCCRFLFGGGPVLHEVYQALRDGRDLDSTLGALR